MKKITKLFICILCVGFVTMNAQTRNTLEFDATSGTSFANAGTSTSYSQPVFTAEAWVNIYAGGGSATIMSNMEYVNGGDGSRGFTVRLNGQKAEFVMGIGVALGDWFVLTATNDLPLNTWTHVAVVFDGTSAEIFYNGVSEGSLATTNPILVSAQNFYLGEHPTWSGRRFSGQLSDVRIWSVARTAGEIQSSMGDFLSGTETGLVANWKLDEGSGMTASEQVNSTSATLGTGTSWKLNTTLGVKDTFREDSFGIYPNPSKDGMFKIKSAINETVPYGVYTITGKLVKAGKLSQVNGAIDLSDKPSGLYMLKGTLEGKHFVKRLIVN